MEPIIAEVFYSTCWKIWHLDPREVDAILEQGGAYTDIDTLETCGLILRNYLEQQQQKTQ